MTAFLLCCIYPDYPAGANSLLPQTQLDKGWIQHFKNASLLGPFQVLTYPFIFKSVNINRVRTTPLANKEIKDNISYMFAPLKLYK